MGRKNEFVFYNHETGKPFVDLDAGLALACHELLGHSSIAPTMRYTHTNLDSKRNAVAKLEGFSDDLVTPCTKMQQATAKVSPIIPLKGVASYT
jgi:hypothetical protein